MLIKERGRTMADFFVGLPQAPLLIQQTKLGRLYPGVMHKLSAPCASYVSGKVPPYEI